MFLLGIFYRHRAAGAGVCFPRVSCRSGEDNLLLESKTFITFEPCSHTCSNWKVTGSVSGMSKGPEPLISPDDLVDSSHAVCGCE